MLSDIVNRVFLNHQTLSQVLGVIAIMFTLMLVRAGLIWTSDVIAQHAANRVKGDLRGRLTAKLFALGPTYTRGERTGELVHAATAGV